MRGRSDRASRREWRVESREWGARAACIPLMWLLLAPVPKATTYETVAVSLPDGSLVLAQLADTQEKRALGLMHRKTLPADQGMLFVFDFSDTHGFWMKNCQIPLDIVWLNGRKQIVHMERNLPPCKTDDCPTYTPAQPALYAVELQAGTIDREQLALGQAARADAAFLADDPLPGHAGPIFGYLVQRVADRARVAAAADDRRDIAVARDHTVGYLLAGSVDALIEGIVRLLVHGPL